MSDTAPEPRREVADLLKLVAIRVPGATPELVEFQLGDTLADFTQNTATWRRGITIETTPGEQDYQLASPSKDTMVLWLLGAATDRPLNLLALPYGDNEPLLADRMMSGPPRVVASPSPGLVRVWPEPAAAYQIHLQTALVALSVHAPLPTGYLLLHREALLDGALHRLYATPNMPFSNLKLAEFHGRRYRVGKVSARIAADKTLRRGFQPVMPFPTPPGRLTR